MNDNNIPTQSATTTQSQWLVSIIATALFVLGSGVMFTWHFPQYFGEMSKSILIMAYNTAICIVVASFTLRLVNHAQMRLVRLTAVFILTISVLTLLENFGQLSIGINYWFTSILPEQPKVGGLMASTTAICFILISCAFLLLSVIDDLAKNRFIILIALLDLLALVIALIALLSHGIGLVTTFVWLGIKMATHTGIGISLLALAILIQIEKHAVNAFNRLNFFYRMATGFGFMAILVIAIGSIAFMQIHTVSEITHELYQNPLQTSNSAGRIKVKVGAINRLLKNLAIEPENKSHEIIPLMIADTENALQQESALILQNDAEFKDELTLLAQAYTNWKIYISESYNLLNQKNYNAYNERTLGDGQEQVARIEAMLDQMTERAQSHITELNKAVIEAEEQAKKLVLVIVSGFLMLGLAVSILITKSVTRQLNQLRIAMLNIALEKPDTSIPFLNDTQEIGEMARALAVFSNSFSERRLLETRLRQVIEAMPNGIIMIDKLGVIEVVNAQAENIFGYHRDQLIGKSIDILLPHEFTDRHREHRNQYLEKPTQRAMGVGQELFGLHSTGHRVPVEIGLEPIKTNEGIKILASIIDITERKEATRSLNKSRELLELTTRVNAIGIWEYNADTGKLVWNDTMFDIYGRNKNYFTADFNAWKQCVHPEDFDNAAALLQAAIDTLSIYICKFRIITPDGSIKYVHAKAKAELMANNERRLLGTNIDITREEMMSEKLYEMEALRSAIVESSEDAIISKTPEGIITSWNLGATHIFGYTAEEAIGQSIMNLLIPPHLLDEEENLLAKVRSGLVVNHFETLRLHKDKHLINISVTLSPIRNTNGKVVGVSAIKRNITEAIKTTKMLAERKKELEKINLDLERSNHELETFAYVASHDLKSPLRGVAQLSTWIEEDIAAQQFKEVQSHTIQLRRRIQRMEKLLDDLLIFYRAGKFNGEQQAIDTHQMVKEIFDIQNNKPGLLLELSNSLPIINTFSTPLEQVIRNLLSNAIKHHDRDQGIIKVDAKDADDNFVVFSVSDDGPGIPSEFHQRIFGMFQTLKTRDELEGSGMGLALIKKIVENYGGKVTLVSEGRGACFSVYWPKEISRSN